MRYCVHSKIAHIKMCAYKKLSCRKETLRLLRGSVTGRRYVMDIIGLSSTTVSDVIGMQAIEFGEKKQNGGLLRRSELFKVIEVGINRKPV